MANPKVEIPLAISPCKTSLATSIIRATFALFGFDVLEDEMKHFADINKGSTFIEF